jgi:hypothetical protein
MNTSFEFDRQLAAWLDEQAPMRAPDALLGEVTARAARTRHRPAWATLERWISMETRAQFGAVPRAAIVLATLALLTGLIGVAIVAAQPEHAVSRGPDSVLAFDANGDIYTVRADGTAMQRITRDETREVAPVWSPDASRIAF